jgi:hypothetical protein
MMITWLIDLLKVYFLLLFEAVSIFVSGNGATIAKRRRGFSLVKFGCRRKQNNRAFAGGFQSGNSVPCSDQSVLAGVWYNRFNSPIKPKATYVQVADGGLPTCDWRVVNQIIS